MGKDKQENMPQVTSIDNLLYTVENEESLERTKAELNIPDPKPEKALGVLSGNPSEETIKKKDKNP